MESVHSWGVSEGLGIGPLRGPNSKAPGFAGGYLPCELARDDFGDASHYGVGEAGRESEPEVATVPELPSSQAP